MVNKKAIVAIFLVVFAFLFVGCGKQSRIDAVKKELKSLKSELEQVELQLSEAKSKQGFFERYLSADPPEIKFKRKKDQLKETFRDKQKELAKLEGKDASYFDSPEFSDKMELWLQTIADRFAK